MLWLSVYTLLFYITGGSSVEENLPPEQHDVSTLFKLSPIEEKRSMEPTNTCRQFAHYPNSIALDGGRLKRLGEGYTIDHCTQACLDAQDFMCAGVLVQLPATCFLTGYNLRNDYFSQHYLRVCTHGTQCFKRHPYKSADFTHRIDVPSTFRASDTISELYCMAVCEQRDSCVGFDFVHGRSSRPKCMFQDLQKVPDTSFDLYIRRC